MPFPDGMPLHAPAAAAALSIPLVGGQVGERQTFLSRTALQPVAGAPRLPFGLFERSPDGRRLVVGRVYQQVSAAGGDFVRVLDDRTGRTLRRVPGQVILQPLAPGRDGNQVPSLSPDDG